MNSEARGWLWPGLIQKLLSEDVAAQPYNVSPEERWPPRRKKEGQAYTTTGSRGVVDLGDRRRRETKATAKRRSSGIRTHTHTHSFTSTDSKRGFCG
jgi:hypothetical protein